MRALLEAAIRVLGEGHDRRGDEEGVTMSPTINCPYCQLPQEVPEDPPGGGEVYCSNCGVPLPSTTLRPPTVLWIDDDPLLLGLCVGVLEGHGYRVLPASDGAAGLAMATQERPDVILLDVLMPTMSGFEVCEHLRADPRLQDTPIMLLTALRDPTVRPRGVKVGATSTLRKPSNPAAIVELLDTVLRQKRGSHRG